MHQSSTLTEEHLYEAVQKIFDRMANTYGKKFYDQWGHLEDEEGLKKQWCRALTGYTVTEIKRGVKSIENGKWEWPPMAPQFCSACREPADSPLLYYEAVAGLEARQKGEVGSWSHPAVYWAAAGMSYDLRSQGYSAVRSRWEHALKTQFEKKEWAAIPKADAPQLPYTRKDISKGRENFLQWKRIFFSASGQK